MALEIKTNEKKELVDRIAKILKGIKVRSARYPLVENILTLHAIDGVLPQSGSRREEYKKVFGENSLIISSLLIDYVQSELRRTEKEQFYGELRSLIEYSSFSDPRNAAEQFIAFFESLPFQYRISIPLPREVFASTFPRPESVEISNSLRVSPISDQLKGQLPAKQQAEFALLLGISETTSIWPADGHVVQVDIEGYLDLGGRMTTYQDAVATIRSLFGAGLSRSFFIYDPYAPVSFPASVARLPVIAHRKSGDTWVQVDAGYSLESEFSACLRRIRVPDTFGFAPAAYTIVSKLKELAPLFDRGMELGARRAARWYFDSLLGANHLLSFLQKMIAVEILLGEEREKPAGLKEILQNRCAYLIAKDSNDRAKIMKDFGDIYKLRSQIVHNGHVRVSDHEWGLTHLLDQYCRMVIAKEIDLLPRNG